MVKWKEEYSMFTTQTLNICCGPIYLFLMIDWFGLLSFLKPHLTSSQNENNRTTCFSTINAFHVHLLFLYSIWSTALFLLIRFLQDVFLLTFFVLHSRKTSFLMLFFNENGLPHYIRIKIKISQAFMLWN